MKSLFTRFLISLHFLFIFSYLAKGSVISDTTVTPIFADQISFLNEDTVLFYLRDDAGRLDALPCAKLYRKAKMNTYFQFDGEVKDYYVDHDVLAADLMYDKGKLNGPGSYYYKNGGLEERGEYRSNERVGIWNYWFDNGQKAKTINFTDSGMFLIDCFLRGGTVLAEKGNGRFEGRVVCGKARNQFESLIKGPIKGGRPDGEWNMYNQNITELGSFHSNIEIFDSGRFVKGISMSLNGTQEYFQNKFSSFESFHPVESLDYYTESDHCATVEKMVKDRWVYGADLKEIHKRFAGVLMSGKFRDYKGWVFLDIKYDKKGHATSNYVRLIHENKTFEADLTKMLGDLSNPGPLIIDDVHMPFEKFYIVLVDANEFIIPAEMLKNQYPVRSDSNTNKDSK